MMQGTSHDDIRHHCGATAQTHIVERFRPSTDEASRRGVRSRSPKDGVRRRSANDSDRRPFGEMIDAPDSGKPGTSDGGLRIDGNRGAPLEA